MVNLNDSGENPPDIEPIGENKFRYGKSRHEPVVEGEPHSCYMVININLENHENNHSWYHIQINFAYPRTIDMEFHPFYQTISYYDGENQNLKIIKNSLSEGLVNHLLLDLADLESYSEGFDSPDEYQRRLILSAYCLSTS